MIYEDEEKYEKEKPSHVSYKEYKKRLESNPNEGLILFISAFFVMLLIFLGTVKQLSPDVDVSIGDNSDSSVEDVERGSVDDRLRQIQMEDNSYNSENVDETFSPELEEKVRIPKQKTKTVGEQEGEAEVIVLQNHDNPQQTKAPETTAVHQNTAAQTQPQQPQPVVNAKVIVGYYATAEQAEVAKSIIQDAGLNIQPFVKNIGSAYTLQVGSFSSKEKAQSVANDLLKNNFPARVIIE